MEQGDGRVVVITGGASGIGLVTAQAPGSYLPILNSNHSTRQLLNLMQL